MKKNLLLISSLFVLAFFSCEKPKEIRVEKLVTKWWYTEVYSDDFPGGPNPNLYTTPPYPGKCEYSKDYFWFWSNGAFESNVYGSDCSDSINYFGTWIVIDNQLEIVVNNGQIFSAEILKLWSNSMVLKTKTSDGKYRIWAFDNQYINP